AHGLQLFVHRPGYALLLQNHYRFCGYTNMRRARNNVRIAYEKQTETLRQLQKDVEQAVLDREGYAKETIQMEKKVKADALAYQITLRKFEEGLMSPLDVQTNATILLNSKADLLQRRLLYIMKCRQVDYYKGQPLIGN
ncbi:TolC family protein, partial [Parabacteroides merdae]|uniref:TolC family protein n=1 Tax=Parabacteroides merdae TaxID=46503 RepID=UPI00232DDE82